LKWLWRCAGTRFYIVVDIVGIQLSSLVPFGDASQLAVIVVGKLERIDTAWAVCMVVICEEGGCDLYGLLVQ